MRWEVIQDNLMYRLDVPLAYQARSFPSGVTWWSRVIHSVLQNGRNQEALIRQDWDHLTYTSHVTATGCTDPPYPVRFDDFSMLEWHAEIATPVV